MLVLFSQDRIEGWAWPPFLELYERRRLGVLLDLENILGVRPLLKGENRHGRNLFSKEAMNGLGPLLQM